MAPPLLTLSDIRFSLGDEALLDGAELSLGAGERLCLVGRNGSGKSTLLRIAAGESAPDSGERFLQPGVTVRYLSQEPDLSGHGRVLDYVAEGLDATDGPHRAQQLLDRFDLTADADPATLSGGEARRAALARVLAPRPEILLLDEPTNHLDLPTIEWLEGELRGLGSAMIVISHDRRFLENLGQAVIWLDRGSARRLESGFADFEAWRDRILEEEEQARRELDRKIDREMQWLHKGVTARRKRNQGRLRALQNLRQTRREQRGPAGRVEMTAGEGPRSGKRVIEAEHIAKSYDGRPIVADLSARILRGDRVGIVGPNGAGKTTLVRMLLGELQPDSGTVTHGAKLEPATLDQGRRTLDPTTTLADALTGGTGADTLTVAGKSRHVVSYMQDFLFAPGQARTPVSKLSGGERGRLMLARALARPSNLLALDEPTNDLDLETLDVLQELLGDYDGTVLLVSHDRDFLDRVVTSVIHYEGDGRWIAYAGGYADMLAQRGGARETAGESGAPAPRKARKGGGKASGRRASREKGGDGGTGGLSFTERHKLDALPGEIESLEATVARLEAMLAEPDLYQRDPDAFQEASDALAKAQKALETAEEEWLRLESRREAADGAANG